ncbi:MAG: hypothetical protein LBQ90_06890 [Synergistaceae bacterium]|jgi:diaminopimelate epimerase|nr:hypothetical protein [Synergistaceae bacterium]
MMEVDFVKISPTQNMTLLITSPVPGEKRADCAAELMRYDSVHAEQAGFVETPANREAAARLQMSGGEFCGNAAMALAALIARDEKFERGVAASVLLEVSGSEELVKCIVTPRSDGGFTCKTRMPVPKAILRKTVAAGNTLLDVQVVHMQGITHLIVSEPLQEAEKNELTEHVMSHSKEYTDENAIGVMFLEESDMTMRPFVCVPSVRSAVWERGCGTGSCAVGCALTAKEKRSLSVDLRQPGGIITVSSVYADGEIRELWIEGKVYIAAEGKACYGMPRENLP